MRDSLISTYKWHIALVTFHRIMSDLGMLVYSFFISLLIGYIYDAEASKAKGGYLLAIFIAICFVSNLFNNAFFFQGYFNAINMRKAIVIALFNKVSKLSLKSLAETNTGKLITLVSSDIFVVERNMQFAPMIISAPICNIATYIFIGFVYGWRYSGIIFGLTVILVAVQFSLAVKQRQLQG